MYFPSIKRPYLDKFNGYKIIDHNVKIKCGIAWSYAKAQFKTHKSWNHISNMTTLQMQSITNYKIHKELNRCKVLEDPACYFIQPKYKMSQLYICAL